MNVNPDALPGRCRIAGCSTRAKARGLCSSHHNRAYSAGRLDEVGLPPLPQGMRGQGRRRAKEPPAEPDPWDSERGRTQSHPALAVRLAELVGVDAGDEEGMVAAVATALAAERDKYRSAASVLCAAHVGVPQVDCPVCAWSCANADLSGELLAHRETRAALDTARRELAAAHQALDIASMASLASGCDPTLTRADILRRAAAVAELDAMEARRAELEREAYGLPATPGVS